MNVNLEKRTITISSLGKLGGVGFTPIINPPDVAIISMSKTYKRLVLAEELDIMPIAMSYDHRVIDGATAARFTSTFSSVLSDVSYFK